MTSILGINAYHGDASAALVIDGQLVAAGEEENASTASSTGRGFLRNRFVIAWVSSPLKMEDGRWDALCLDFGSSFPASGFRPPTPDSARTGVNRKDRKE